MEDFIIIAIIIALIVFILSFLCKRSKNTPIEVIKTEQPSSRFVKEGVSDRIRRRMRK